MIVKTRDLNGKDKYFNAFTGKEVRLQREPGRFERQLPDYVLRFIWPRIELKQGFVKSKSIKDLGIFRKKLESVIASSRKKSLWSLLIQWFKSLFNGKR